jgi:hypothetical protein
MAKRLSPNEIGLIKEMRRLQKLYLTGHSRYILGEMIRLQKKVDNILNKIDDLPGMKQNQLRMF